MQLPANRDKSPLPQLLPIAQTGRLGATPSTFCGPHYSVYDAIENFSRVRDSVPRIHFSRNPCVIECEVKAPKIVDGASDHCFDLFFDGYICSDKQTVCLNRHQSRCPFSCANLDNRLEGSPHPRECAEPRLYRHGAMAFSNRCGDAREHNVLRHCAARQVRHSR